MRLIKVFLLTSLITSVGCSSPVLNDSKTDDVVVVEDEDTLADDDSSEVDSSGDDDLAEDSASGEEEEEEAPSPITWTDCSGIPGDKACDFMFQNQDGNDWSLYDHYGTVMVVDFSTIWCGVCKSIAGDVQVHQDSYTGLGYDFLWVTVLVDGPSWGVPPESSEIQAWVDEYGMTTSPVLAGDRTVIDTTAADGYPIVSWPTLVVIDETMTIHNGIGGWSESIVFGWVDEVLGIIR
jgi:thiol-disulfide isomerase/thioredoxin